MEPKTETKDELLNLIREILKNERFKVDAYFFCGFPTDQPNEKLVRLCDTYLNAPEDEDAKNAMLAEMERMTTVESVLAEEKNVLGGTHDIRHVLNAKALLD